MPGGPESRPRSPRFRVRRLCFTCRPAVEEGQSYRPPATEHAFHSGGDEGPWRQAAPRRPIARARSRKATRGRRLERRSLASGCPNPIPRVSTPGDRSRAVPERSLPRIPRLPARFPPISFDGIFIACRIDRGSMPGTPPGMNMRRSISIRIPTAVAALVIMSAAPAMGQSSEEERDRERPRSGDVQPEQKPQRPSLRRRPRPPDPPPPDRSGNRGNFERGGAESQNQTFRRFEAGQSGQGSRPWIPREASG